MLQVTSWRIHDQVRKRDLAAVRRNHRASTSTGTTTLGRIPDPGKGLEATWDEEWGSNLMANAIERVKMKVELEQYQMFDLYVLKQWPVSQVAEVLRVRAGSVYMAKFRVGKLLKKEIAALKKKPL